VPGHIFILSGDQEVAHIVADPSRGLNWGGVVITYSTLTSYWKRWRAPWGVLPTLCATSVLGPTGGGDGRTRPRLRGGDRRRVPRSSPRFGDRPRTISAVHPLH